MKNILDLQKFHRPSAPRNSVLTQNAHIPCNSLVSLWLLNEYEFSIILEPREQKQYLFIFHFLYVTSLVKKYQKGYFWLQLVRIDPYTLKDIQHSKYLSLSIFCNIYLTLLYNYLYLKKMKQSLSIQHMNVDMTTSSLGIL